MLNPQQTDGAASEGLQLPRGEFSAVRHGKKGCLGRGCLILGAVLLLIVISIGGCIYLKYRELRSLTEAAPVVFEEIRDRGLRAREIRLRLETFLQQALSEEAELVLTVEELNVLLLEHQDQAVREYAKFQRFRTVDTALFADVSLPIDWLSARLDAVKEQLRKQGKEPPQNFKVAEGIFGLLQGRYFNAAIELGVNSTEEKPRIVIRSIRTVGGKLLSMERPGPGQPPTGGVDLDRALESVSDQALEAFFSGSDATVKSIEIRPGSVILRGHP